MLLDDVMSELDAERRGLLAELLSASGQAVVSATDADGVPGAREAGVTLVRVEEGAILGDSVTAVAV
jgi:recombinational DNA repair ATPase RecF